MPTPAEIVPIYKVSMYLATEDVKKGSLFSPMITPMLPIALAIFGNDLEWGVDNMSATDPDLISVANYVFGLCGMYGLTAQAIISGATGGGTVTPGTPISQSSSFNKVKFIVGASGSPMVDGDTVYTLNDTAIPGKLNVYVDEELVYSDIDTQFSYTVAYNNADTVITFNAGVSTDQKIEVQYFKSITGIPSTPVTVGLGNYIFIATVNGTTSTGAISALVNATIVMVIRDQAPPLSPSLYSFNSTTGEIILLGGGANFLDADGQLSILYVTT